MQEYQAVRTTVQEVHENEYHRYVKLLLQENTDEFTGQNKRAKEDLQDVQEILNRIWREANWGSDRGVFKQHFLIQKVYERKYYKFLEKEIFC